MTLRDLVKLANKANAGDTDAMMDLLDEMKQDARKVNAALRGYEKNGMDIYAYDPMIKFARSQRGSNRVRRVLESPTDNMDAYDIYQTIAQYRKFESYRTFTVDKAEDLLLERIVNIEKKSGLTLSIDRGSELLNLLGYLQTKLPKVYGSGDEIEIVDSLMSKDDLSTEEYKEMIDAYINDYEQGAISAQEIYEDITGKGFYD